MIDNIKNFDNNLETAKMNSGNSRTENYNK